MQMISASELSRSRETRYTPVDLHTATTFICRGIHGREYRSSVTALVAGQDNRLDSASLPVGSMLIRDLTVKRRDEHFRPHRLLLPGPPIHPDRFGFRQDAYSTGVLLARDTLHRNLDELPKPLLASSGSVAFSVIQPLQIHARSATSHEWLSAL
jgi:hypothetical protein